jgi:1-acyl-sn-glycerol-3-phosphate acyltransferase
MIADRQELIESSGKYVPLLVFPEGGTTNGSSLIKFKKGAFLAEKRVTPIIFKYD